MQTALTTIKTTIERNQTPHSGGNLDDIKCNYCM